MVRRVAFVFAIAVCFSDCFADTFINRTTGKSFNGYIVQKKRGDKTQVRVENSSPLYLDIGAYEIRPNHLGRKNKVIIFSIKNSLELAYETEAFEKALVSNANQGPLFILIEIDTPGCRTDLARRICDALINTDNCTTIAFVSGDKVSGAFAEGAMIALACDKVYMRKGTAIGAAPAHLQLTAGSTTAEKNPEQATDDKLKSAWPVYCSILAERKGRPGLLAKAMAEKDVEVVEIIENNKHLFITPDKTPPENIVRTWVEKGSLLTLTADQAAQCGIADKIVASREELLADLAAAKATQVQDGSILKARREFEKIQRDINAIISSVNYLKEQSNIIINQFDAVEAEFRRANNITFFGTYRDAGSLQRMRIDRDRLFNQSLEVLNNLMGTCRKGLSLTANYPDLSGYTSTLEANLKSAETRYRELNRPLY